MPIVADDAKTDTCATKIGKSIVEMFEHYFALNNIIPKVHFELEGCVTFSHASESLDYKALNRQLENLGVLGELKDEYWSNQWEYVSKFANQSPLKEATDLHYVIHQLPQLLKRLGARDTFIKPVMWAGDSGQLAEGSKNIFTKHYRDVHIPNAVQINVSAQDLDGNNLIATNSLGEHLQQKMLNTSYDCCLLFLPEEEAFERIELKTTYGLADELSSPTDISGGHQGSIALYREHGKHNQLMGESALILDANHQVLVSQYNWQETARVEHRLGASSIVYNAFANTVFALANLADALEDWKQKMPVVEGNFKRRLPTSLACKNGDIGAIKLFEEEQWFANKIDQVYAEVKQSGIGFSYEMPSDVGHLYKALLLKPYQRKIFY